MQKVWPFLTFAILVAAIWIAALRVSHAGTGRRSWNNAKAIAWFVAVESTILLVTAIPTGSVDVSDLWRFLTAPLILWLPIIAFIAFGYIGEKWTRRILQGASVIVATPAMFLLTPLPFPTRVREAGTAALFA